MASTTRHSLPVAITRFVADTPAFQQSYASYGKQPTTHFDPTRLW